MKSDFYLNIFIEILNGLHSHLHAFQTLPLHLFHGGDYEIDLALHAHYKRANAENGVRAQRDEPVGEAVSAHRQIGFWVWVKSLLQCAPAAADYGEGILEARVETFKIFGIFCLTNS